MARARGILGTPTHLGGAGGGLVEVGAYGILGALLLGSFFVFPAWLSPLGVALFVYGWWRGNATVKALGVLMIGVQIVQALGVVDAAANKIAQIRKEGVFKALGSKSGVAASPATASPGQAIAATPANIADTVNKLAQAGGAAAGAVTQGAGALRAVQGP